MRFVLFWMFAVAASAQPRIDPRIATEIANVRAVDNHAHPVIPGGNDREFDALPVDNMEPSSDPVRIRAGSPETIKAWQALYGVSTLADVQRKKQEMKRYQGESYPIWVLDKLGIGVMLANRVAMGGGIRPPRFRWVSYVDALLFPLNNSRLAAENSDRKAFFGYEDKLLSEYLRQSNISRQPPTLDDYLVKVVTPTLERQKRGGAVAVKYEAAYLRSLDFEDTPKDEAARIYAAGGAPSNADYKKLQDFLFRYIAAECGRLGMAVHLHTMAGAGSYFRVAGANPLLLESVLNDPRLRKTNFVMIHGGWPFTKEITPLLEKPNAYLDFSAQDLIETPVTLAHAIREWLEFVPEKVMFGTDAYPYSTDLDWEESGWVAANTGRQALGIALTAMVDDGEITYEGAIELARMVLAGNARKLYGLTE